MMTERAVRKLVRLLLENGLISEAEVEVSPRQTFVCPGKNAKTAFF